MRSPSNPCVILASCRVGAGHNQAGKALLAGLHETDRTVDAQFVDVLDHVSSIFRACYAGGYNLLVSRFPWLYGFGYRLMDLPEGDQRTLVERVRLWSDRHAVRPFLHWLIERRPALVVNTHYLQAPSIGRMISQGVSGLKQMVVVTDNELHRWWFAENVHRWFVPNDHVRGQLLTYGVPPERVDVTGIPVHPKWLTPLDQRKVRADWNLPMGRSVVLVSAGVHFTIGRMDRLASELARRIPEALVLVLAGGNKELLQAVSSLPEAQGREPNVRAVSFTDRIHELVDVADIVVTKPGGMITSECTVKGAGLVLMKPVPGQEAANAAMLHGAQAAVVAKDSEAVVTHVMELLRDRPRLEQMRVNARLLARPGANAAIVQQIRETLASGWS